MNTIHHLVKKGLINPPKFLADNVCYETIMGSMAYGVSTDSSDMDIYGFCIPPKDMIFPHLAGEIPGFGRQKKKFDQFQEHHILDKDAVGGDGRSYDLAIFSIVKYFSLCMENNPNMIDSLFTPQTCVRHCTKIGSMVREQRKIFLHKGAWHKFKGYAYGQIHKMKNKNPSDGSNRKELIDKFGYDVKFAYHVVRLLDEVEQILTIGDINLQRNNEQLKAIRRGEWSEQQILEHFDRREIDLQAVYDTSKLPHEPDEDRIKVLLMNCLEEHYGNLNDAVVVQGAAEKAIAEVLDVLSKRGYNR